MREENERKNDKARPNWMQYWPVLFSLCTIIGFTYKKTSAISVTVETLNRLKLEHDTVVMPSIQRYETHLALIDERTLEILRRLDKIDLQTRRH
jgi:hypothetical protein